MISKTFHVCYDSTGFVDILFPGEHSEKACPPPHHSGTVSVTYGNEINMSLYRALAIVDSHGFKSSQNYPHETTSEVRLGGDHERPEKVTID